MNKVLIYLICVAFLAGCNGNLPLKNKKTNSISDSIKIRSSIDSQMALGERPDSEQEGPSFDEVKGDLLSQYDKIESIDTVINIGNDSLHVHEKYYCLHDNSVRVPKGYLWGGDKSKDFIANSFVSHIMITNGKDTIINKIFKKSDFDKVINPEERSYAIIFEAGLLGYQKLYDSIVFSYSITIPLTDVGVAAFIAINKKGEYKILDESAKMDYDLK